MTDRKIIIDGIDVSQCEYFRLSCKVDYSGEYLYKNVCRNHGFHDCDKRPCSFKCIEYKKQLKRKEKECEELHNRTASIIHNLTGGRLSYSTYTLEGCEDAYRDQLSIDVERATKELEEENEILKSENFTFEELIKTQEELIDNYKQALERIEKAISDFPSEGVRDIPQTQMEYTQYFLSINEAKLRKILNIIYKAKE